jgi:thiosulfate reductase cytochrome b subunit
LAGHFRRNVVPTRSNFNEIGISIFQHLRFARPSREEAWSYNVLQRVSYLVVIFVLFPLMIWTGLAMSYGFVSAFPLSVRLLGGHQTARSLHFVVTILVVHIVMIFVAGFGARMRAMITGRADPVEAGASAASAPTQAESSSARRTAEAAVPTRTMDVAALGGTVEESL